MYKKYRRGADVADGIDTALSVTSVGLAASSVGLLSTIIAAPVAIGLQAGALKEIQGGISSGIRVFLVDEPKKT